MSGTGREAAPRSPAEIVAAVPSPRGTGHAERAYRTLAQVLGDPLLAIEGDRIVWASPAADQVLGSEGTPLVGSDPVALVHPDDATPELFARVAGVADDAEVRHARVRLRVQLRADGPEHAGGHRWFVLHRVHDTADGGDTLFVAAHDVQRQVQLEEQLRLGDARMHAALDASPDGFATFALDRGPRGEVQVRRTYVNAAGTQLAPGTMTGSGPLDDDTGLTEALHRVAGTGVPERIRTETATAQVLDVHVVPLDEETLLATWRDVTDLLAGERLLAAAFDESARARATLHTALDATVDAFIVLDLVRDPEQVVLGFRIVHLNAAAAEPLDREADALIGLDFSEVYPPAFVEDLHDLILASAAEQRPRERRMHEDDAGGSWVRSYDATVAPVGQDRVVLISRDATEQERARRVLEQDRLRAEHDASHDALTGLPNRVLLLRRLEEALRAARADDLVAVIFCDLDGFKLVNDTYGHATGDAVLATSAQRLAHGLRRDDTAARLAGDEFVVVLRHLPRDWDPEPFLDRMRYRLRQPVETETVTVQPSASLGLVLADPLAEETAQEVLQRADQAMYAAKAIRRPAASPAPGRGAQPGR